MWAHAWDMHGTYMGVPVGSVWLCPWSGCRLGFMKKAEGSSKKREQQEQNQKPGLARCVWGIVNCLPGQGKDGFKKAGLAHSTKCCKDMEAGEIRQSDWIWLHKIPSWASKGPLQWSEGGTWQVVMGYKQNECWGSAVCWCRPDVPKCWS